VPQKKLFCLLQSLKRSAVKADAGKLPAVHDSALPNFFLECRCPRKRISEGRPNARKPREVSEYAWRHDIRAKDSEIRKSIAALKIMFRGLLDTRTTV